MVRPTADGRANGSAGEPRWLRPPAAVEPADGTDGPAGHGSPADPLDGANTMEESPPATKAKFPTWVSELFNQFLDRNERLTHVLRLSIGGISMIRGRHQALKVLAEVDGKLEDAKHELERAEKDKELAQREVENDFPLLHEQATIALWSSLEALVRSFLARWLANTPAAWQCDTVKKLRVRLGDYEGLEPLERCLWVVDLVDQEVSGPLRNGVTRFESLLQPFGLGGSVEPDCQRTLFELSQVRHVLVHRSGVVDRKLTEACPWLNLKAGDHLQVSHKMWRAYDGALGIYVLELIQRVRVHFGLGRHETGKQ